MAKSTEADRIKEIADKYRAATPDNVKRTILRDFIIYLAKENIMLADENDLITVRGAMEWAEAYIKENHDD